MPRILTWNTLPTSKKIYGEKTGMSFRAGNKFKISSQSFIEYLLLGHFPPFLQLLTLSEGRTYPSTNNAHREILIENGHFCVQAVFWISSQRYRGTGEKKKEVLKPFVISHTQQMPQIYQIKHIFFLFYLETVINSFYSISFPSSVFLFQIKELYSFSHQGGS